MAATNPDESKGEGVERRDFLTIATTAFAGVGIAGAAWPFIDQMNPSADVLALSSAEIDISGIPVGQEITATWRGKPIFIRHRTEEEIAEARADDNSPDLIDPETDAERVQRPEWLIVIGICTHLGCIPLRYQGDYGGWFCPCHGSHYDTAARIRKGPAPKNLYLPPYKFLSDTLIKIG